jgi:hypothetical protein
MGFFKRLVEGAERLLYTVDEWLRFRSGEGRLSLYTKPVLGLAWFYVTYVVRFSINLVIEPQINPIKHFPVVTVSHKLTFALIVAYHASLQVTMGDTMAGVVSTALQFIIPGICGFLAWELKENWKLYQANQSPTLDPIVIGGHGETMIRFMRLGMHSGTLPKLYSKLRRAARRGEGRALRKQRDALHHVEESILHFIQREFLKLLEQSKGWGGQPIVTSKIQLGINCIRLELSRLGRSEKRLALTFEEQTGWLIARIERPGWLEALSSTQAQTLRNALIGLYKRAGVDVVAEQLEASLGGLSLDYCLAPAGLAVWSRHEKGIEAVYDLEDEPLLRPRMAPGHADGGLPTLTPDALLFGRSAVTWERWVEVWQGDQAGQEPPESLLDGVQILPPSRSRLASPAPPVS